MIKAGSFLTIYIVVVSFLYSYGAVAYEPWGQVDYLEQSGVDLETIFDEGIFTHAHYLRFVLVSVPYYFSDIHDVNLNEFYSVYLLAFSVLFFLAVPKLVSNIFSVPVGNINAMGWILLILVLLSIMLVVNGRAVFALLGVVAASIVSSGLRKEYVLTGFLISTASLVLSSVSSGVFMISYTLLSVSILRVIYYGRYLFAISLFILVYWFFNLVMVYLLKVLAYYDVSDYIDLFGILSHGILSQMYMEYDLIFACAIALAVLTVSFYLLGLKNKINKELFLIIFIIFAFGVFGDLTLSMLIIPLLVVAMAAVCGVWFKVKINPPSHSALTR